MTGEPEQRKIYAVGELTRLIRRRLESGFGSIWVEGEVSNLRRPASGHLYFTLKDPQSQIQTVMFRGQQRNLRFALKDGLSIRVCGELSVYEPAGNYQIIARTAEEAGKGALQVQYEKLKKKLAEEGLFETERKRPLPLLPQRVAVVTSPTGAAIRDFLNVTSRRYPNLHIVIIPARVQGEDAAEDIVQGLAEANRLDEFDVIVLTRGGGSLEDLWCFNDERVARAIFESRVPVLSAVGHEIDFTIADFVADLRAPTPSAAAEILVGCKDEFEERITVLSRTMQSSLQSHVLQAHNRLLRLTGRRAFREPLSVIKQEQQRVDASVVRIERAVKRAVEQTRRDLSDTGLRVRRLVEQCLQKRSAEISVLKARLRTTNPVAVLDRGYSITYDAEGNILRSADEVRQDAVIKTRLANGEIFSRTCKGDRS